jgi:DNA polymerase III alpha subunit
MFVELSATTNFTFLFGASHPEEMMVRASEMGLTALAVADVNSVAGIVRAHTRAKEMARDGGPQIRLIPAARIVLASGYTVTVLPRDRQAWARLSRLLSVGRLRVPKGECELHPQDLIDWGQGMEMLIHPPGRGQRPAWEGITRRLTDAFPGQCSLLWHRAMTGRTPPAFPGCRVWPMSSPCPRSPPPCR